MQKPVIGIIGGKGRMGKLFADFFADRGLKVLISDIGTKLTNAELAAKADIAIISVPIDKTEQTIQEVIPHLRKESALMDFTSVKITPLKAMLKAKCEVTGLHPMFGNSNPIPGQTLIICPTRKSGKWTDWLEDFFTTQDLKIVKMTAKQHDKMMNVAQGLIHFAEITFADSLRRSKIPIKQLLQYTGKASELKVLLAARLIDQDPGLYGNIQIENAYSLKSLKQYQKSVDQLLKIVKKKDFKAFERYFKANKKFLGDYTKEAHEDSSHLIEKFKELNNKIKPEQKNPSKPTKNSLALLGPAGTFSDLAADKHLANSNLKKYYAKDIDEVFELVATGKVKQGIVPVENSLQGSVRASLDGLFQYPVHIISRIEQPIEHSLISLVSSKKSDIKTIISHDQALNQCKNYLKKNFPNASLRSHSSTAGAVSYLLETHDPTFAVIASKHNAQTSELKVITENIADNKDNLTQFIVIEKGELKLSQFAKQSNPLTSIAFHFDQDSPGSLFTVFQIFADAKINLTKIESRPTRKEFGDYIFYLDFEGEPAADNVQQALKSLSKKVAKLKIFA